MLQPPRALLPTPGIAPTAPRLPPEHPGGWAHGGTPGHMAGEGLCRCNQDVGKSSVGLAVRDCGAGAGGQSRSGGAGALLGRGRSGVLRSLGSSLRVQVVPSPQSASQVPCGSGFPPSSAPGGTLWSRGACCSRPRWVPKVYRATGQIRSSRELTPHQLLADVRDCWTLFWGLNTVPPLVTLSPTSIRSYSQLSPQAPAQTSPLFLLLPPTSDSNPVLWPIRFPPPTSDTTRGHSNKVPSTMSQRDGTFRAHKNWSHFPARETSLQAPGGITGITAEKIGSDGEEGS